MTSLEHDIAYVAVVSVTAGIGLAVIFDTLLTAYWWWTRNR